METTSLVSSTFALFPAASSLPADAANAGVTATLSVRTTASSSEIILLVFIFADLLFASKICGRAAKCRRARSYFEPP